MNETHMPDPMLAMSETDRRNHEAPTAQHRRLGDSWRNKLLMLLPTIAVVLAVSLLLLYLMRRLVG